MPEEATPESLSDAQVWTPGIDETLAYADRLLHSDVYDVDGRRLGRVTKCYVEGGALDHCQVTLDHNTKGLIGSAAEVVDVFPNAISGVDAEGVRLKVPAAQVAFPSGDEGPSSGHMGAESGAKGKPRKVR